MSSGCQCDGFFVTCIDWRIQEAVEVLYKQLTSEYGHFDRVQVSGGAGNEDFLMHQLEVSLRLHEPDVVVLTGHDGCGAGTTLESLIQIAVKVRLTVESVDTVLVYWLNQEPDSVGSEGWFWTRVSLPS